jgi:hypothetical protein
VESIKESVMARKIVATGVFPHSETKEETAQRKEYEQEYVKKFFQAECSHSDGELYSFTFSRSFLDENALFRADVLKDLSWQVERLYHEAISDMKWEGAGQDEWNRNQGRSNQLRGGEDQPEAGQVGDHPDAGDPPE